MNIRHAQTADLEILSSFQQQMAWETESLQLNPLTLQKGLLAVLNDSSKGVYFVIEDSTQVVGSLLITYEWSDWRNGMVWWIQSVYVLPEFRKQGVFKMLYHHIKSLVEKDPSICGLRLYVDKRNTRAQKVYQKIGMNGEHYQVFEWLKE